MGESIQELRALGVPLHLFLIFLQFFSTENRKPTFKLGLNVETSIATAVLSLNVITCNYSTVYNMSYKPKLFIDITFIF